MLHLNSRHPRLQWKRRQRDSQAGRVAPTLLIWISTTEAILQKFCIYLKFVKIQAHPTSANSALNLASGAIWIWIRGINHQRRKVKKAVILNLCGNTFLVSKTKFLKLSRPSKRKGEEVLPKSNKIPLLLRWHSSKPHLTWTNSEMETWANIESW